METKEPQPGTAPAKHDELKMWAQCTSDQPKDTAPMVSDRVSSSQGMLNKDNAQGQLETSMYDDREDSLIEKNSIAEFEQLEKECF